MEHLAANDPLKGFTVAFQHLRCCCRNVGIKINCYISFKNEPILSANSKHVKVTECFKIDIWFFDNIAQQ